MTNKIIKGLKSALAYSKGDKSRGKLTIVKVRDLTPDEQRVMQGALRRSVRVVHKGKPE